MESKNIIRDIYFYYYSGGYISLVIQSFISLLSSYLLLFFFYFVVDCIDYNEILYISSKNISDISEIINIYDWFPTNNYLIICFAFYIIYLICITYRTIINIYYYRNIKLIYNNQFEITDDELVEYDWEYIVNKIQKLNQIENQNNSNILNMNIVISQNENFLIALLHNKLIHIPSCFNLNKILEWNLLFAVISPLKYIKPILSTNTLNISIYNSIYKSTNIQAPLLSNHNKSHNLEFDLPIINSNLQSLHIPLIIPNNPNINQQQSIANINSTNTLYENNICISENSWNEYYKRMSYRLNLILFINICALPFAILIVFVYLLLNNGARIYYKSSLIFGSQISDINKWHLRYYNEPQHKYEKRLKFIDKNFILYTRTHYINKIIKCINEIVIFVLGSFFIILISLSFISSEFAYLTVYNDKNILWCIGIIGSILFIYHNTNDITNNTIFDDSINNSKIDLNDTKKNINITLLSLDNDIQKSYNNMKLIYNMYIFNIRNMINELLTIICMPYIIYSFKQQILQKKEMYKILDYHSILGMVCKYSIFSNTEFMSNDMHMILSYYNFKIQYQNNNLGIILDWNANKVRHISNIVGGII